MSRQDNSGAIAIMPGHMPSTDPVYKRVLLKISGEGFCHEGGFGLEADELESIAQQCVEVAHMGVELAIVVGGGNFIRGATFAEDGKSPARPPTIWACSPRC